MSKPTLFIVADSPIYRMLAEYFRDRPELSDTFILLTTIDEALMKVPDFIRLADEARSLMSVPTIEPKTIPRTGRRLKPRMDQRLAKIIRPRQPRHKKTGA